MKTTWKIAPFPSSAHAKILGASRCVELPLLGVRQPTNCQCTYLIMGNAKVCTGWAVPGAPRVVWWSSIGVERAHTHTVGTWGLAGGVVNQRDKLPKVGRARREMHPPPPSSWHSTYSTYFSNLEGIKFKARWCEIVVCFLLWLCLCVLIA